MAVSERENVDDKTSTYGPDPDGSSRKDKVCFLIPTPFPSLGGFEHLVFELVQAMSMKFPELMIDVVCTGSDTGTEIGTNVKVYPILRREFTNLRRGGLALSLLLNCISFFSHLRRTSPTIVHSHPVNPVSLVSKLFGIPVIGTSHGGDIQKDEEIGYGVRTSWIASMSTAFTLRSMTLHTLVSRSMIEEAVEAGGRRSKIRVVYNGVNLVEIPWLGGSDIIERLSIGEDDVVVLYLGRLVPKKCPDDLVKAFPWVLQNTPQARCVFAGRGEEEGHLKELASRSDLKDSILFLGFVSEQEKWDLLKRCDVFVLPSRVEGLPLALIEAMACEKPVVTTNVGPFPEVVTDGENGFMVPLHSPGSLAKAIGILARDERKRRSMGRRARETVERRFDIRKIADDYLDIYEGFLRRGPDRTSR